MQWIDRGLVLAARPYGENAAILELFASEHGRHLGLVHGGQSPRRRAVLQPGNSVEAKWRGRLPEHLGTFGCELLLAHAARFLDDAPRLLALSAAMALLSASLPEREPNPTLFAMTEAFVGTLDGEAAWAPNYLLWEERLLAALGFGFDSEPADRARVSEGGIDAGVQRTGRLLLREVLAPQGRGLPPARKHLALLLQRAEGGAAHSEKEVLA